MKKLIIILGVLSAAFISRSAIAGYALFDSTTDTISVAGDSVIGTAATIEARVNLVSSAGNNIFNEWAAGYEDKALAVCLGPDQTIYAHLFRNSTPSPLVSDATVSLNTWHHIAYVYDGSQERIYLDGIKVISRTASGDVRDYSPSVASIGATFRGGALGTSFLGMIDTFRFSTIARYTGDSFTAPTGDLTSDSYTNLLYNFNESPGSTMVHDLSGNGRDGYLGTGFTGATSPTLVPEPATLLLLGLGGVMMKRRGKP